MYQVSQYSTKEVNKRAKKAKINVSLSKKEKEKCRAISLKDTGISSIVIEYLGYERTLMF